MKLISVPYIDQTGSGAFTGCESAAAVMLLKFLGIPVTLEEFLDHYLVRESFEIRNGELYGPDPNEAFAGDPRDPEAMGCYAPVIIRALETALGADWEVRCETGASLDDLAQRYLDRDIPVIVWATIDMKPMIPGPEWKLKSNGTIFTWRSNEHCLLLVGYDETHYYFSDSWNNNGLVRHPKALVQERYASQYSQAIAVVHK